MSECAQFSLRRPATRLVQRHLTPAPEQGVYRGDCVRTAIAMILGLSSPEDVPHFNNYPGDKPPEGFGWSGFHAWLEARGVQLVHIPLPKWSAEAIEERLGHWLGCAPAILTGRTRGGHPHVVAVIDGKIVDTVDYTTGNPLVECDTDGLYWLLLLVPMPRSREVLA